MKTIPYLNHEKQNGFKISFALSVFIIQLLISASSSNAQTFTWAKQLGGESPDYSGSVIVDANHNIYTIGYFQDTADFDPGPSVYNLFSAGMEDIFITKMDASGNFVWAKKFGSTGQDWGWSITTDQAGNLYATGFFAETVDFDPGSGTFNMTAWTQDVFILKLSSSGGLIWAKQFGGTPTIQAGAEGFAIAVDSSANVYVSGIFNGRVDFDPGSGTLFYNSVQGWDGFVAKLDPAGNLVWAKSLVGPNIEMNNALVLDNSGNVYTTGYYKDSCDFDPGPGTYILTSAGAAEIYISKLDNNGNFAWAVSLGSTDDDEGKDIAVDNSGNVYIAGRFGDTVDFDPGPGVYNLNEASGKEVFLLKLDGAGNFVWAKMFGGYSVDAVSEIELDSQGNIYMSGGFTGMLDFDPGPGTYYLMYTGLFLLKLNASGGFVSVTSFRSNISQSVAGMDVDDAGGIYVTGVFFDTADFNPPSGFNLFAYSNYSDVYVAKFNSVAGISEDEAFYNLSLYPNPTPGLLNIDLGETLPFVEVAIFDPQGRQMNNKKYLNTGFISLKIDGSPGIYFVRTISGDRVRTFKAVKVSR